ncbi:MAG: GNAT family N-acetyltransferase [Fuerstia sp.]|nr:GNAT family N-acetyltransferase [Fuerstiella sp.]
MPEFTQATGLVHGGVRVVIAEQDGIPVGFLPFQNEQRGQSVAVGGSLNDFQGLISDADSDCDFTELLGHAGIDRLSCSKLLDWQDQMGPFVLRRNPSPLIDLSAGLEGWESGLKDQGSEQLKQLARKERKLGRECGDVRFEFHTTSDSVLQTLVRWKRDQYSRTGEFDVFSANWPAHLLCYLLSLPSDAPLQPILSALYAGKALVAAHYGLRNASVCHWWFPGYDLEYGKYSPGKILLRHLLKESAIQGVTRFDFGAGDESYKYSFANDSVDTCRTVFDRNPARRWLGSRWYRARMALKTTSLGPIFRDMRGRLRGLAANLCGGQSALADSERLKGKIPSAQGSRFKETNARLIDQTTSDRQQTLFAEAKVQ